MADRIAVDLTALAFLVNGERVDVRLEFVDENGWMSVKVLAPWTLRPGDRVEVRVPESAIRRA